MTHTIKHIGLIALAISLISADVSIAGQIVNFTPWPGIASYAATPVVPPSAPNNDNAFGPSPNVFFVTQKAYNAVGPQDTTFDVTNTGGTTEYAFVEGVSNGTGLPWAGYHIELGFNHGASFTKSTIGDGLDFDFPDYDSPLVFDPSPNFYFPTAAHTTEDDIVAGGGVMPNGGFAGYFKFSVDVPDGIAQFTIRQSPIAAPEPCSAAFLAMGVAWVALGCRRRDR
jgi:hypothetical protein